MNTCLGHIIPLMEEIAPASLAESWDNVGLQIGENGWPVKKIWVALDPTEKVVRQAVQHGVHLLICHHPLIFKPQTRIDTSTYVGKIIDIALKHRMALFCAHTNLDAAPNGVNDILARRLGVTETQVLQPVTGQRYRLITYVPEGHEEDISVALFKAGAGAGDRYSQVSFRSQGTGTFEAHERAHPFLGKAGEITYAKEYRLETLVDGKRVDAVLGALHGAHPYEEVVYDLLPVEIRHHDAGLGRIGNLREAVPFNTLVQQVKEKLGVDTAKIVGDPDLSVERVALCGGSGKSLMDTFLRTDAQVFITGDLGYHDGRTAEFYHRALIDIGHFHSEHVVVEELVKRLRQAIHKKRYPVEVDPCETETCCFRWM